jgi:histidine triad (HIT) family protein
LSDESAAALGRVLPRICRAVISATGTSAYNVLENNGSLAHQAVHHVHFHIIPKPDEARGLGVRWPAGKLGDEAAELAARIAAAV